MDISGEETQPQAEILKNTPETHEYTEIRDNQNEMSSKDFFQQ